MSTRMLIDARHQEETRVAIIRGNRIEEFDYESVTKKQIKGNIYLAKVTRVEPSLQAAFVDFGGNRHGFLPFSEIHPDYYQIPVADREALLREEREDARADAENDEAEGDARASAANAGDGEEVEVEAIEGAEEDEEERRPRRRLRRGALRRRYKIQEVIKRRQILLVQVAKEERGSKGAALTTYLSLAGRYCVLMPNSPRGGGISRKIASPKERKKLKEVLQALDVPEGMGCIIRTAGLNRTKSEIKRDFDYLLRLWDDIRELTLNSIAPALIYEEGDLIKRSIRDLYTREVDEILVEGEEGYRTAKEFMSLLMPSHARKVKHYKDDIPLFHRYQVEQQLEAIHSPVVQLKSGGYLVINPTEALVAIDVNSGRATREHNIEETALQTNLEAAEEIARQLRLRDLAGLIVIDFIDMEDRSNVRAVEKRLKEALKSDRARLQVGRISSFGLLEMSRQRLRPNLVEASTITCPRCAGTGVVRSIQSGALAILRAIEEEGIRNRSEAITIKAPSDIAFYLLNEKRGALADLETRYDLRLTIDTHGELGAEPYLMERTARALPSADDAAKVEDHVVRPAEPAPAAVEETESAGTAETGETEEDKPRRKRRRRPRRRRPSGEGVAYTTAFEEDSKEEGVKAEGSKKIFETSGEGEEPSEEAAAPDESAAPARRRRTSRRRKSGTDDKAAAASDDASEKMAETTTEPVATTEDTAQEAGIPEAPKAEDTNEKPRRPRRRRAAARKTTMEKEAEAEAEPDHRTEASEQPEPIKPEPKPDGAADAEQRAGPARRPRRRRQPVKSVPTTDEGKSPEAIPPAIAEAPTLPAPDDERSEETSAADRPQKKKSGTRRKKVKVDSQAPEKAENGPAEKPGEEALSERPAPKRRSRRKSPASTQATSDAKPPAPSPAPSKEAAVQADSSAPRQAKDTSAVDQVAAAGSTGRTKADTTESEPSKDEPGKEERRRRGWWQRAFG